MAVFDFVDYSVFLQYDFDIIRPVYLLMCDKEAIEV